MDEQRGYPFEFSVVMAVYNVEPFLREAVDSLLAQDFGFEHIQLIMVDDGSTDGSGAICDEYARQYPENVMAIHKGNGGVSSARNEGLKYIRGRYVNFMDADDKLSENTMSAVSGFFRKHKEETDVAAIPIFFFDGEKGAHPLNGKFKKGTRVVNLIQEWQTIQLSCSTAFIQIETARDIYFDTALAYGEDGAEMLRLLMKKMTLGVIGQASYFYRKRTCGPRSALQTARNRSQWYIPCLKGFIGRLISISLEQRGYVPKYIQYALMYDIQWRVTQANISINVLTEGEAAAYKDLLFSSLKYFDDDVIIAQKNIQTEHKVYLLKKKYGHDANILWGSGSAALYYQNTYLCDLSMNKTHLDFISVTSKYIRLEGYTVLIAGDYSDVKIFLRVNGEEIPCVPVARNEDRIVLDDPIYYSYGFIGEIPIDPAVEVYEIGIFCKVDGNKINKKNLTFGKYSPVSSQHQNSYFYCDGYVLTTKGAMLYVQKCGRRGRIHREYSYLKELWKKNRKDSRKAIFVRLLTAFLKIFTRKKMWIISDRIDRADDNGEAFFQYVSALSQRDIKAYFALSPESADYKRMKKIGKVIPFLGKRYKILYLLADCIVSSQGEDYIFRPFQQCSGLYRDLAQSQKFIFLQHGVICNDLSDWLSRFNKNISMFVTTTALEYESILNGNYDYTSSVVKLTGLPRHDKLCHQEKKMITIMPTWRAYLVTGADVKTGRRELGSGYCKSQYFVMFSKLLNSQRLFDAAQKMGYTIAFHSHPNMLAAKDAMKKDHRLAMLDEGTPYRTIFAESNLLVTDYSSVAFDFAYLRKPIVYFQQDRDEFFSGAHTVKKGYFDYEEDGFGEVEYSVEALVDRIIEYMEDGCKLKEKYRKRIDETFPFSDQNNCQRVYEEILKLK